YRNLQRHLDKQAVGFPATRSGAEIRILKRIFNPEEAELAMYMSYQQRSHQEIFETVKPCDMRLADMEKMLDKMVEKGGIGRSLKENTHHYYNIPFVVGMYEWQLGKLTPEFLADIDQYFTSRDFGLAMLSTKLPQMRTIPVEKSIRVDHHVTTYDNLREIISGSDGPIGINECICRKRASIKGKPCRQTSRLETCMVFGEWAKEAIKAGISRHISPTEALEIARQNEAEGLVLQPSNDQKVEFLCACCGCCCGMLSLQKMLPKPVDFWATNFYATVNTENCSGCGTCVERCLVKAAIFDEKAEVSSINLDRCIGCGNCVTSCPSGALGLTKKEKQTVPPEDSERLYKTIGENKLGTLGKIKLITRLVLKK
ncbi:MAG: 4Fe-4S ferredoxin iron-sulfur binding domain protein, partial [Proteobacteria bacterium]|nr:4Fe-4S ferredoxin iron-sulfur binding domain protein [Pseudomonadota bacterium]